MTCLSTNTTRALVLSSLPDNSEPRQTQMPKPSFPKSSRSKNTAPPGKKKQSMKKGSPQRPTLVQIERAISVGRYRDMDVREEEKKKKTEFDGLLPTTRGQFETPVEETLRKAGRWLADNVAKDSGSAGKEVVLFLFRWFLPIWTLLLLMGVGVIKLPFPTPLDDLFM